MIVNKADLKGRIDGFGLIVPRKENRHTLAISYSSNKYAGRTPDDQILLRLFLAVPCRQSWSMNRIAAARYRRR